MHSGHYDRFFPVLNLAAQNCRDLAVALRIGETRAPELVNYPSWKSFQTWLRRLAGGFQVLLQSLRGNAG